jgi:EAL domain-containing protein (putative c-di-GMP-specific phosphodiesterase class I)
MISLAAMGASSAAVFDAGAELGRGAILGALVIGAAYLAGYAVFRRGSAAVCALLMVVSAAALQFSWLGFLEIPSQRLVVLLQGLFAASTIIFLSAVIRPARNNALLGGLMFAGALTFVGLGIINLVARGDASGLMRIGLVGVGVFAVILSLFQARRDLGAQLILPGALIALAAPIAAKFFADGAALSLAPHALFTMGVLAASLVALTDAGTPAGAVHTAFGNLAADHDEHEHEEALRVSENQLAQVLDYTGVAVWDWCPHGVHQTNGLSTLLGADSDAGFTPDVLREFIHKDDAGKFDSSIIAVGQGDGGFDTVLRLHNGRPVRIRGARAVDSRGEIERMVAFIENAPPAATAAARPVAPVAAPVVAKADVHPLASALSSALDKGDINAAFQPIVSLESGRIAGFEALARWRDGKNGQDKAKAEDIVRAAEGAAKGGALARHILKAAAAHLAERMRAEGSRDLFVALNISVSQLKEPGFADAVRKAIADNNLPPRSLVLELTESQAITDDSGPIFRKLKDAGASLAFDDFGAGFSSLSNLQKYSFDYLKIDKQFIDALTRDDDGAKIARAVASLGRDLGLTVIAEGVETKETAEAARQIGCDLGQGYAFGVPKANDRSAANDREPPPRVASRLLDDIRHGERDKAEKPPRRRLWGGDMR